MIAVLPSSEDVLQWAVGGGAGQPNQLVSPTGFSPGLLLLLYTPSLQWSDFMVLNIVSCGYVIT